MYIAGLITFIGLTLLLAKLDRGFVKKALGYDLYIDIVLTGFVAWLLAGTYSGMIAAMVTGLAFSVTLYVLKQFIGYDKLERQHCPHCHHATWAWRSHPPAFQKGLMSRRFVRVR